MISDLASLSCCRDLCAPCFFRDLLGFAKSIHLLTLTHRGKYFNILSQTGSFYAKICCYFSKKSPQTTILECRVKRCKLILCHATQETPVMQPTRCTRCPRKKCGILVATKIQVTSIDDIFCMRSVYSCRYVMKIFDIKRRCKLTGPHA